MAATPLTLDTLSNAAAAILSENTFNSPLLLSPSGQEAIVVSTAATLDVNAQLSNTPSPSISSAGSLSPSSSSFLPEMPQWKRDLIQRRKQNIQRTISASSPLAALADGTAAAPPAKTQSSGLKTSQSSSSVRSLAGSSNANIDQVASSDAYFNKYSSPSSSATATTSLSSKVNNINKKQQQHNKPAIIKSTQNTTTTTATLNSPIKEKSEKLFGGQYPTAATYTKEKKDEEDEEQQQSENIIKDQQEAAATATTAARRLKEVVMAESGKARSLESSLKTKDYNHKQEEEDSEEEEEAESKKEATKTQITAATTTTTATCLTGSSTTNTSSFLINNNINNTNNSMRAETNSSTTTTTGTSNNSREQQQNTMSTTTTSQMKSITGANVNITSTLTNQSHNKCESERLACTANNTVGVGLVQTTTTTLQQTTSAAVVKISEKLKENKFIKNEFQQDSNAAAPLTGKTKYIKFNKSPFLAGSGSSSGVLSPTNKPFSALTPTSSSTSTSSSSSSSSSSAIIQQRKKMVAAQEIKKSSQNLNSSTTCNRNVGNRTTATTATATAKTNSDLDNAEDLSYGPGIVSKLRCRYLSLALRESMEQQKFNRDQLRRSTSLNNLLDKQDDEEEDEDDAEATEEDEEQAKLNNTTAFECNSADNSNNFKIPGILKKTTKLNGCSSQQQQQQRSSYPARMSQSSHGSNGVGVTFTETSYGGGLRGSRHLKRGNDSLKRARSVEALLSEKSPWQSRNANQNATSGTCGSGGVSIEDKIQNARERLHQGSDNMPPKRLTSIIDDTERPPPDLVKQTLKMFEATANRRPRITNRTNSKGEVASKVETFRNIIKEQKPAVSYPKPLSPTKKLNKSATITKSYTTATQAADLIQSPLGRKTMMASMAAGNGSGSGSGSDSSTPLKQPQQQQTANTLSDHTPDIIPRQKLVAEHKEKFNTPNVVDSSVIGSGGIALKRIEQQQREQFTNNVVDSPITALTKEMEKLQIDKNAVIDNKQMRIGAVGGGVGGIEGDAYQQQNNEYDQVENNEINIISSSNNSVVAGSLIQTEKTDKKIKNNETAITTATTSSVKNSSLLVTKAAPTQSSISSSHSSDFSDEDDDDDDEEVEDSVEGAKDGCIKTKRITRTALDNIQKAGTTQQFKFNSSSLGGAGGGQVKQIGVIRPLLNTSSNNSNSNSVNNTPVEKSAAELAATTTTTTSSPIANNTFATNMETLKHSPLTSREIEKNRINDLKKSSSAAAAASLSSTTSSSSTSSAYASPACSSETSLDNVINTKSNATSATAGAGGHSDVDSVISATNSPLWAMRKRRQAPPAAPAENTSMVFNFSNRKEVPDYIESDGVIFRRRRELPKPNESGFVLLGDLSVETSTDMDYDDFSMCPPSPCDVEFVNANIVIDGKSSIRQKSKDASFHVQFNDTLTSTFEYPSEASMIFGDDSFASHDGYTQPIHATQADGAGGDPHEFHQHFQNFNLEEQPIEYKHLHVADEIIQLPTNATTTTTNNVQSPANNSLSGGAVGAGASSGGSAAPTKNILGNLPLDVN